MKKKHSNFDSEVKSYKWLKLKEDPPKNAVLYVLDPVTKEIELFITDKNGVPRTVSTVMSSININDYVTLSPNNEIQVQNNQLYVKKYRSGDEFINIVSTPVDYKITLNEGKLELLENKQDDLTHDGTGTKYPTVDAVNTKIQELEESIDNVSGDKNFTYHQNFPSATWEIIHNLNKKPSVTVVDSANTVVEGHIIINDGVKILITFNAPFTGIAILN